LTGAVPDSVGSPRSAGDAGDERVADGALRSAAASGDSEDTADIAFFRKIRRGYY